MSITLPHLADPDGLDRDGSPRIPGTGLVLALTLDGLDDDFPNTPVNMWADVTSVVFSQDEDGTRRDAAGLPRFNDGRWHMEVTAVQSTEPGSLWSLLWDHAYRTVPFQYAPHGNPEPSPEQPHFVGRVNLGQPPNLGGEAGEHVEYTFTARLPLECKPYRVTDPEWLPGQP